MTHIGFMARINISNTYHHIPINPKLKIGEHRYTDIHTDSTMRQTHLNRGNISN